MAYYPAYLDLAQKAVLLVGGGRVAGRKLAALLEAGATVRLVSPELHPKTAELAARDGVERLARGFEPEDLEGVWLCVCSTDDEDLNRKVAAEAEKRRLFVNVVDVPPLCSFIVPASLKRGELHLAISTGGASPAVAAALRRSLESQFGPEWADYLKVMRAARGEVLARGNPSDKNKPLFESLAAAGLLELISEGDWEGVDRILRGLLGEECGLDQLGLDGCRPKEA